MIQEIKTNLGTFDKFLDLAKFMKYEGHESVMINHVKLWSGSYLDKLKGRYTEKEIYQVVDWK